MSTARQQYLTFEIQLLIGEGWDRINRFNPITIWCLSQARTWISKATVVVV